MIDVRELIPCGTVPAFQRHWRRGEQPCQPCRDAMNKYARDRRTKVAHAPASCLFCGAAFTPRRSDNAGFCSRACSGKHRQRERREAAGTRSMRPCLHCESPFVAVHRDAEVCSKECRNALRPFRERGLAPSDYRKMLDDQGHCCASCAVPLAHTRRDRHIDHGHETGAVRGILCPPCNLLLGHAKDNPEVLRAAAAYLERHHI